MGRTTASDGRAPQEAQPLQSVTDGKGGRGVGSRCLVALRCGFEAVADVLLPRHCMVCGAKLGRGEDYLCAACLLRLPRTRMQGRRGNVAERLFWGLLPIVRAHAFMHYRQGEDWRRLFFQLKYFGRPDLGRWLGRLMAADLAGTDFFEGIDLIVPVPLHRRKHRLRGYNQSEELARGVASLTGLPVCTDAVERVADTPTQTRLTAQQRRDNVKGAFRLIRPEVLAGRHVLLIDDVLTTNATLLSCGGELAKAGGVRLSVLTLGLAGHHPLTADGYEPWR